MASAVRRGVAKLTGDEASSKDQEPDKYRLLVTAGPSYDTSKHSIVPVNGDNAITVSNEFINAKVKVRVRGYRGLPSGSPSSSAYFKDPVHERDQYSLGFSFVPKQDIPSLDTVWGNDFDHPVRDRLPPGFNTAFKIVKEFIDPGLSCDAYAEQPWLYGPSLSCWFAFRIGDMVKEGDDFPAPSDEHVMKDGADGSGEQIRADLGVPENNEKRRKFFLDADNRKKLVFQKGRVYQADFYNPYLDFGNLALKLPGFSIKVFKYIDAKSHCLRYVFKNRETGDLYLNVNFNLLWGEKLQHALEAEKQDKEKRDDNSAPGFSSTESKDDVLQQPVEAVTAKNVDAESAAGEPGVQHDAGSLTSTTTNNASSSANVTNPQDEATSTPKTTETSNHTADVVSQRQRTGQQAVTHSDDLDVGVNDIAKQLQHTASDDKRGSATKILE